MRISNTTNLLEGMHAVLVRLNTVDQPIHLRLSAE